MQSEPTAVTYIGLPIGSGGAHGLGRMKLRDAYERTLAFLSACAVETAPREQRFTIQDLPGLSDKREWEPAFRERFGGGSDRLIPLRENQTESALAFLEEIDPQPKNRFGVAALWLSLNWRIQLVDPRTGHPFPGQEAGRYAGVTYEGVALGESRVRLILSNRAAIGVELCLPDVTDDDLGEVVPVLQQHAPFRFAPQHWKRWTPTKRGSFVGRKIQPLG